jgi:transcriptional regulator with XRE-family HTH domain
MESKILDLLIKKKDKSKDTYRDLEKVCGLSNGYITQIFNGKLKQLPFENKKFLKLLDHYNLPHHEPTEETEDRSEGHRLRQLQEMIQNELRYKTNMRFDENIQNSIPALIQVLVEGGFDDDSYKKTDEKAYWNHSSLLDYFYKNDTWLNPFGYLGKTVNNYYWDYLSCFDSALILIRKLVKDNLKSINKYGPTYQIEYLDRKYTLLSYNPEDKDTEIVMSAYKTNKDFKELVDAALKLV